MLGYFSFFQGAEIEIKYQLYNLLKWKILKNWLISILYKCFFIQLMNIE
jgi:hypothetical protein